MVMFNNIRQRIANWIEPNKRIELHENWQSSANERLGDYTDKPYDHYAQYHVTVDEEYCNIMFDIYVADIEDIPNSDAWINVHESTKMYNTYDENKTDKIIQKIRKS